MVAGRPEAALLPGDQGLYVPETTCHTGPHGHTSQLSSSFDFPVQENESWNAAKTEG